MFSVSKVQSTFGGFGRAQAAIPQLKNNFAFPGPISVDEAVYCSDTVQEGLDRMMSEDPRNRVTLWFKELRGPLRRFIAGRRVAVSMDIEDVAQEVFLRLLRYSSDEVITDPRAYLFKIASNVASEWSLRAKNRHPHESVWLENLADDSDLASDVERNQRNLKLYHAINALPPRARKILQLRFSENLSHGEISAQLGITQRVVKRDILRSFATLRFMLHSVKGGSANFGSPHDEFGNGGI